MILCCFGIKQTITYPSQTLNQQTTSLKPVFARKATPAKRRMSKPSTVTEHFLDTPSYNFNRNQKLRLSRILSPIKRQNELVQEYEKMSKYYQKKLKTKKHRKYLKEMHLKHQFLMLEKQSRDKQCDDLEETFNELVRHISRKNLQLDILKQKNVCDLNKGFLKRSKTSMFSLESIKSNFAFDQDKDLCPSDSVSSIIYL